MPKRFLSFVASGVMLLALFSLAACGSRGSSSTVVQDRTVLTTDAGSGNPLGDFRLGAGDRLRISIFGAEKLSGEYQVDLSGTLGLPLVGTIRAAGQSPVELAAFVTKRLQDEHLMDNPQVSVEVLSTRPFYILGEIEKPGEYPYRAGLNVISAIATAGGFHYRADKDHVFIRRGGSGAEVEVSSGDPVPIYPGDIIRVPDRLF